MRIDKNTMLYSIGKKIFRFIIPNLRNQMMYTMIPEKSGKLIKPNDKVLIIAPHPDDEVIACGGIIAKYSNQIDILCINSSGVKYEFTRESAEEIADLRIKEFYRVMKEAGIHKFWIAKIWGVPPMFKEIKSHISDYMNNFDWKNYDFIFLPHRYDGHREHRYVGNHLIPQILNRMGYKRNLKIVRYEVWGTMNEINYFEDISMCIDEKKRLINLYESRAAGEYSERIGALNFYRGLLAKCQYAEAYKVETIKEYLKCRDDKSWKR